MNALTPGEKIKILRLELGLRQDDIANEEVSKSLISMIEKNKRGLTWKTAHVIAKSLSCHFKPEGRVITPEFLMETEIDRVLVDFNGQFEILKTNVFTRTNIDVELANVDFQNLFEIANKWDLKKERMELIYLRGRFNYYTYQYNEAMEDFTTALEYYLSTRNYNEVARIYNLMGICYHIQMLIDQALTYYGKCYEITRRYNIPKKNKLKVDVLINIIICNRKIKKYDKAIQYIKIFKEIKWKDPYYSFKLREISLIEANNFLDLKMYEEAEEIYNELLQKKEELDKTTLFLVYENYAILCREKGQIQEALEFLDSALNLKYHIEVNYYLPEIYLQRAKCYFALGKGEVVLQLLMDGIKIAENSQKNDSLIDLHFACIEIYIKQKDFTSALKYIQAVEKIIEKFNIVQKENDLYSYYIELYFLLDKKEECIKYINKVREYTFI